MDHRDGFTGWNMVHMACNPLPIPSHGLCHLRRALPRLCAAPLGSTSQAPLQLPCLGIGPLQLCPGSRAQVGIQPCHLACNLQSDGDSYREYLVPIGNLPVWSQARPAESPSCPCYFGIEGKIWLQKPFTSSLQTWFHTFCLKSSSLLCVAPKIFRKATAGHPT